MADLTGNGKLDLLDCVNPASVAVVMGNGDGTFPLPVPYDAGPSAFSVTTADLTGNGVPDILTANDGGSVSVLLGNGGGSFQQAVNYPTGTVGTRAVAVGDVNGDGVPDLVAANYMGAGANSVSVLLGNGDGSFRLDAQYATGMDPQGAALGDFNGAGLADVVTANGVGSVSVLLNAGDWPGQTPGVHVEPFARPSPTGPMVIHEDPAGQPAPEKDAGANGGPVPDSNEQQAIPAIGGQPAPPGGRRLSVSVRRADPLAGRVAGDAIWSTLWD